MVFSAFPGSLVWCLTIILEILSHYCFKYFFFSFFWYYHYKYDTFCSCLRVLRYSGLLFFFLLVFFLFAFKWWKFPLTYTQVERVFPQFCLFYQWAHQRHSSFLSQCFWSLDILLLLFFPRIFISLITWPIWYCMQLIWSVRALTILFIIVLNPWSNNPNVLAMSGSEALSLQIVVFVSSYALWFFFLDSQAWCTR